MLRRLTNRITKLIDTAHEAAHAVSACVELAREATEIRKENAEDLRTELQELRERYDSVDANLAACETERDKLRVELKSMAQDRDQLHTELERVQLEFGKATEERDQLFLASKEPSELELVLQQQKDQLAALQADRDALARKLDWLTRWRSGKCPLPPAAMVLVKTNGSGASFLLEAEAVLENDMWRPANINLYDGFRDA